MNNSAENRTSHARRSPGTVSRTAAEREAVNTAEQIARRGKAQANQTEQYYDQPQQTNQSAQYRQTVRTQNPQTAQNVPSGQTRQNPQSGYRFEAGSARQPNHATAARRPNYNDTEEPRSQGTRAVSSGKQSSRTRTNTAQAVVPVTREDKKLIRQQKQAERMERFTDNHQKRWSLQEKAEEAWQRDIVRVRSGIDRPLLILALALLALGSVTVMSASYPLAVRRGREAMYFAIRQLGFAGLGIIAMLIGYKIPYEGRRMRKLIPIFGYALSAVLLVVVIFIGVSEGEAQRWIQIPGLPITIQPSEMMKLAIVMMLALYADVFRKQRENAESLGGKYFYNVLVPTAILGVSCGLVLIGKHLSGTMIIGGIGLFLILMMVDRKTPSWWAPVTIGVLLVLAAAVYIIAVPYARTRFMGIINPGADIRNDSWQSTQSLYAVGSGGLFGVGIGQSRQKYSYLAASHTDFIFAIWCEEFGFLGAVALIFLFLAFLWRGYRVASRAQDQFTMLTAYGITTHFAIQIIGHMIVDTTYINTGISLPFFSYGGSSLLVQMFEVGMLLRISTHFYKTKADIEQDEIRKRAGLD